MSSDSTERPGAGAPRIVVVQAEGFPAPDPPRVPVGVRRWKGAPERLVIVVKTTFTYAGGALAWAPEAEQEPLTRGERSALPGASPEEIRAPSDFVPGKVGADVLVTGSAFSAAPVDRIDGALRLGDLVRSFTARASGMTTSIPLSAAYLSPGEPLSGRPPAAHMEDIEVSNSEDLNVFNSLPQGQRAAAVPPDATLDLVGLTRDGGRRALALPGLAPEVWITGGWVGDVSVEMRCDTLWIDTDAARVVLVWRGAVELFEGPREVERIAVAIEPVSAPRSADERRAALQRGHFGFAVREVDLGAGAARALGNAADDEEATRLRMARYATWGSQAPPPRLALAAYARLAAELAELAELAERPAVRAETLARHRLDEDTFAIEERAWLEKMAASAMEGDTALVEAYSQAFLAAQEALATPGEERTLVEYAQIRVGVEDADEPHEALRAAGLSLAAWMRVERRWAAAAERDPAIAAEIERRMREARGAGGAAT